jgi:hypothetical protein
VTARVRKPYVPPHACGKCPARWSGINIAHCSACHKTFGGVGPFDAHRAARYELGPARTVRVSKTKTAVRRAKRETRPYGQCYNPMDSGLVLNNHGVWESATADDRWDESAEGGDDGAA